MHQCGEFLSEKAARSWISNAINLFLVPGSFSQQQNTAQLLCAREHFSLLLGSPRSRDRHPALLRLFRSLRITSRAGWAGLGWTRLCWRILYTVKRHRYLVQDNFYVRGVITPNVRCLVHFFLYIFLLLSSSLQTSLRPHDQCKIALIATDAIKLCRYRTQDTLPSKIGKP